MYEKNVRTVVWSERASTSGRLLGAASTPLTQLSRHSVLTSRINVRLTFNQVFEQLFLNWKTELMSCHTASRTLVTAILLLVSLEFARQLATGAVGEKRRGECK